jgi:hypothetical protein
MSKFARSFVFVLVGISFVLAACGGSAATEAPAAAEVPAETPAAEVVV